MELIAKKNKWLTQASLDNEAERGFWKRISLAYSLTAEDFRDATQEEKDKWDAEHPAETDINQ